MTSSEHWRRREDAQREKNIRDEAEYAKELRRIYEDMMDSVQKEIDAFYARYAAKEGITLAAAKRRADKLDIEAYERKAKKYVREKNFSKQANDEMRLYNLVMKVNRLELLKANIGLELVGGFDEMQKFFDEKLTDRTLSEFRRQAGILGESVQNNAAMAHAIVNASFHNATFSDRIWMHQDILKGELAKQLQIGLIQGKGSRDLARNIRKRFDVSRTDAERLMVTELRRVQTGAAKLSYQTNGNEEYQFLALNPEVNSVICNECRKLDGKHFKVSDMKPGENAPPMHPRCHCATAPYWDEEKFQRWLEYLDRGGNTAEWNDHGLEESQQAKTAKPKNQAAPIENSENSSKIELPEFNRLETGESVNEFFYYDDYENNHGLMAKRNSQYRKWMSGLSKDSQDALYSYAADGYGNVNGYLRKKKGWETINPIVKEQIARIDDAISSFTLKDSIVVQRGAKQSSLDCLFENYDIVELSDLIGKKYKDDAFMSSTVLAGNPVATTKPVVFDISIPAGTGRGAYINEFGGQFQDAEYEFLIKRGATFTVTDISEDVDLDKIHVKMVMDVE